MSRYELLHFLLSYTPFLDSQVMTPRTTIVKIMTSLHSSRTSYFIPTSRWWLFASCVLLEWAAIRCSRDVRRHQSEPLESRLDYFLSERWSAGALHIPCTIKNGRCSWWVSPSKVMSRLCRHTPSMALHLDVNPDWPLARTRSRRHCVLRKYLWYLR